MLSVGAVGAISVLANLVPRAVHEMCSPARVASNGKFAPQLQLFAIDRSAFADVSPIAVKAALEQMGVPVGSVPHAAG